MPARSRPPRVRPGVEPKTGRTHGDIVPQVTAESTAVVVGGPQAPSLRSAPRAPRSRTGLLRVLYIALFVNALAVMPTLAGLHAPPAFQNWATILVGLTLQAIPFLALGVVLSAAIHAFVSDRLVTRLVPRRSSVAVPVAAIAAAALPGCECSSVPVAGRLVSRGVNPAAALTFLLAAPALNPVVLVATAVAFPGRPEMVLARFVASFLAATVVGLIWSRRGDCSQLRFRGHQHQGTRTERFFGTMLHDFAQAGGYLVLGATLVATLQSAVAPSVLARIGGKGPLAIVIMALLAVLLSICSEADAFVAASLVQFSLTARLVFLTVSPMVDMKLFAMQIGAFGRRFAVRFAPLTFVCAVGSALLVARFVL